LQWRTTTTTTTQRRQRGAQLVPTEEVVEPTTTTTTTFLAPPPAEAFESSSSMDQQQLNDATTLTTTTTTANDTAPQQQLVQSQSHEEEETSERDGVMRSSNNHHDGGGWLSTLFHEPGLGRKVLGTAGTWFLFDIVFYGNTIFQPIVVQAAFGGGGSSSSESEDPVHLLRKTATNSLILTSIALPGYAVAGLIMGKKTLCITQTPRYVMLQGFAMMAILYATIGSNWDYLKGYPSTLVFLYGMTFFFANYGPNTSTFILPSLMFDPQHCATWNGVSAAAGKLGALTGATLFEPAAEAWGDGSVLMICSVIAVVAWVLTLVTVPTRRKATTVTTAVAAAESTTTDQDDLHICQLEGELA
jgi:hypothetical protein